MRVISDIKDKNVIVCPLDWGLGHAARIIPVARELKKNNNRVTVVCGIGSFFLLKEELPDFEIIVIKEKQIKYPAGKINFFTIFRWVWVMFFNTLSERKSVGKIIKKKNIDVVISDNRYGLNFKGLDCYIVTHQIAPQIPFGMKFLKKFSDVIFKKVLSRFKKVLIPDFVDGFSLSGALAGDLKENNYEKIGILSRFSLPETDSEIIVKKYDFLVLISGQEKQRSVFEKILLEHAKRTDKKILFVRGISSKEKLTDTDNVKFYNSLTGNELRMAFLESETVVCRAGYSTLCDLCALGKKAVIIATPGQSEQEFLAERLDGKFGFRSVSQTDLEKLKNIFTFAVSNC